VRNGEKKKDRPWPRERTDCRAISIIHLSRLRGGGFLFERVERREVDGPLDRGGNRFTENAPLPLLNGEGGKDLSRPKRGEDRR